MKISIDISLFYGSGGSAFGNVHGHLELAAVPPVGSSISLMYPVKPALPLDLKGFSGSLKVNEVRFTPMPCITAPVTLSLEDVHFENQDDARSLMNYLISGFGLYGDEY